MKKHQSFGAVPLRTTSRGVCRSCSSKHVFHRRFTVDAAFASSNYRIRVTNDHQCMHIRGLEVFGTILPPWRID